MSKTGVPSIMSAPVTTKTGAPFPSCSTRFSFTTDRPNGFGRNGDLVANTPTRVFPPSLGGRTVADQFPGFLTFSENSQISQRWENSSIPRTASGLENSGSKTLFAVMITCFSPDTKRVKTCYFLQRLQISERAFLLWDALAAALCFLLFYCAQLLTVFGLACVYQRSAGYALGPQGVFLMLARDSFLHGLLPFGESVIWTRNILYMVCAGLSCAAASLARRNRNRGGTPMFALVFIISRMPVTLGEGDASCLWLAVVLIVTAIGFGLALTAAHNGKRKEDDDETETDAG